MILAPEPRTVATLGAAELGDAGLPTLLAGRYQILECLGEGGMGVVCRGYDLDLEETVAVKFLRADLADDDVVRARFRREVKLARRVTHPNVARVFEFGRDGALCFLTMEYVPGESLHALLRRDAPLPPTQVLDLALHVCEGLAAAHVAGVVHGDIKPGNVLVAPVRGAVVTDFGISQAVQLHGPPGPNQLHGPPGPDCDANTGDGGATGTPFYMAPEQARGEALRTQSDVYAVGVLLFEALTAASPFPDNDALGLLAYKRRGGEPELARIAPQLSEAWRRLLADCLQAEPDRRPSDARALLVRLHGMQGAAGPFPVATPLSAPLATGEGPRWISVAPLTAGENLAWITADLTHALAQVRGLRVHAGASEVVCPSAALTGRVDEIDAGVRVTLELAAGARTIELSLTQPRVALHQLGAELAARVASALDRTVSPPRHDTLDTDVSELYVQARHAYLTMHLDRALALFEAALARAPNHRLIRLGHTLARVQAGFMFREATAAETAELRAIAEATVAEYGELGEAHLARARVALALGDTPTAARSLVDAIARAPSLGEAYNLLADLLLDIGRLPDAARRLDISLALDGTAIHAWSCRTRLLAYRGEWDEFYAALDSTVASIRFRTVLVPRLILWHPRPGALEALEQVLEHNRDDLPDPIHTATRLVIAFGLRRGDPAAILDRLEGFARGATNHRRNALVSQVNCELACQIDDVPRARRALLEADHWKFTDWQWIEHCPVLGPVRADPAFASVRERVRARADAVADAVWGSPSDP